MRQMLATRRPVSGPDLRWVRVGFSVLCCLLLVSLAHAEGGTIRGRITAGGEALAGANVQLLDSRQGSATDLDGHYLLLAVAPGERRLRISHVGLESQERTLFVRSGTSTVLDVDLSLAVLNADTLVVRAQRPLTPLDATSSQLLIDHRRLEASPVHGLVSLLATQAGVHLDEDGGLHIRGGRRGEVSVIQDGLVLADPVDGEFLTGLNEDQVSELVVESGNFGARYGDALSGVVRISSQELVPRPEYVVRVRSASLLNSPWRHAGAYGVPETGSWRDVELTDRVSTHIGAFRLAQPGRLQLKAALPASLIGADLILTALSELEDSHLPHGYSSTGDLGLGLGRELPGGARLQLNAGRQEVERQGYSHMWKYLPENQSLSLRERRHASLSLRLPHGTTAVSHWRLSQIDTRRRVGVRAGDQWLPVSAYRQPASTSQQDFYASGTEPRWSTHHTDRLEIAADLEWRQSQLLAFSTGIELRRNHFEREQWELVFGNTESPDLAHSLHETISRDPRQASLWLQQKLELDWLVLDAGLRLDAFDPVASAWASPEELFDAQGQESPLEAVDPWRVLSPRLGLAFPVDERTVMHASYGKFVQFPDFDALYTNPERSLDLVRVPLLGYPGLAPQETVAFELGFKRRVRPGATFELTAWHKDIRHLMSTVLARQFTREFVVYANTDNGQVSGLDLATRFPLTRHSRLFLDYTIMTARGTGSTKHEGYEAILAGGEIDSDEFPLDFDQRHDISAELELDLGHDLEASLLLEAASGLPYTPYVSPAVDPPRNSAVRPWTRRADASLRWSRAVGKTRLALRLDAENLLDRRNVVEVFASTGDPYVDTQDLIGNTEDLKHNPSHVSAPRSLRLGFELRF